MNPVGSAPLPCQHCVFVAIGSYTTTLSTQDFTARRFCADLKSTRTLTMGGVRPPPTTASGPTHSSAAAAVPWPNSQFAAWRSGNAAQTRAHPRKLRGLGAAAPVAGLTRQNSAALAVGARYNGNNLLEDSCCSGCMDGW